MWHVLGCVGMVIFLTIAFIEWNECYLVRQVNVRAEWFAAAAIIGYATGIAYYGAIYLFCC